MCRHFLPAKGEKKTCCPNHPIQLKGICLWTTDWVHICRIHIPEQRVHRLHFRQLAHIYLRSTEQTPKLASSMLKARHLTSTGFIMHKYCKAGSLTTLKGASSDNFPDRSKWRINIQLKKGNLNTVSTPPLKKRREATLCFARQNPVHRRSVFTARLQRC